MIWLDLDARLALNTGTPSVEAHWGAVTSGNIFQYHMVFEKAIFIFHVTFFNVTWKMKLLLHCYTFRKKISNNIFFGPILMELHFLFMNDFQHDYF